MKCVKSVLGGFSSGVSICRNKGTQSDLGKFEFRLHSPVSNYCEPCPWLLSACIL